MYSMALELYNVEPVFPENVTQLASFILFVYAWAENLSKRAKNTTEVAAT